MQLTEKEKEVLKIIKEDGYITSKKLKYIFDIKAGKKGLTKKNLPNIRFKLESFHTAIHPGPYRGGWAWFSCVEWKNRYRGRIDNLKEFMEKYGII